MIFDAQNKPLKKFHDDALISRGNNVTVSVHHLITLAMAAFSKLGGTVTPVEAGTPVAEGLSGLSHPQTSVQWAMSAEREIVDLIVPDPVSFAADELNSAADVVEATTYAASKSAKLMSTVSSAVAPMAKLSPFGRIASFAADLLGGNSAIEAGIKLGAAVATTGALSSFATGAIPLAASGLVALGVGAAAAAPIALFGFFLAVGVVAWQASELVGSIYSRHSS